MILPLPPLHVYTFRLRFVPLVQGRLKRQTFRLRQRNPQPGHRLSHRTWSGLAYRSPQTILLPEQTCLACRPCTIAPGTIVLDGCSLSSREAERFAVADGFADVADLFAFMTAEHGLGSPKVPQITGTVTYW